LYIAAVKIKDLVTAYLLQHHECVLPGIGEFKVSHKPASFDDSNNLLLPAAEEIVFREGGGHHAVDLIAFIALKEAIPHQKAEERLNSFCAESKEEIRSGGKLAFETFGSLQKNAAGNIYFSRDRSPVYFEPVKAEIVYHEAPSNDTPATEPPYYNYPESPARSYWWLWAAILFAIVVGVSIYHFSKHPLNSEGIGNVQKY